MSVMFSGGLLVSVMFSGLIGVSYVFRENRTDTKGLRTDTKGLLHAGEILAIGLQCLRTGASQRPIDLGFLDQSGEPPRGCDRTQHIEDVFDQSGCLPPWSASTFVPGFIPTSRLRRDGVRN